MICEIITCFLSTVILGFEHESYSISEGNQGSVEVCVKVKSGVLRSSLHLSLTTMDGDATGKQRLAVPRLLRQYTQLVRF